MNTLLAELLRSTLGGDATDCGRTEDSIFSSQRSFALVGPVALRGSLQGTQIMKRPFQKLVNRAGWAAALASALGFSSAALAQVSPYHPLKPDRAGSQVSRPWPTSMTEHA